MPSACEDSMVLRSGLNNGWESSWKAFTTPCWPVTLVMSRFNRDANNSRGLKSRKWDHITVNGLTPKVIKPHNNYGHWCVFKFVFEFVCFFDFSCIHHLPTSEKAKYSSHLSVYNCKVFFFSCNFMFVLLLSLCQHLLILKALWWRWPNIKKAIFIKFDSLAFVL